MKIVSDEVEDFNKYQQDNAENNQEKNTYLNDLNNSKNKKDINELLKEEEPPKLSGCEKIIETIWPVRYKKRTKNDTGELYIKTKLKHLFIYVIFLVIVCIIVYGMVGLINFHFSNGMLALFIDQDIESTDTNPQPKRFRNGFITYEDAWKFMRGPLLDGLHFEVWYDLTNTTPNNIGYIFYQNKILGRPRLLQLRVNDDACKVPKDVTNLIQKCYASYSSSSQSKQKFGKALDPNINTSDITYSAWYYQEDPDGGSYSGLVSSYEGNGYMITLGEYRSESEAILNDLYTNGWIDEKTRAIIIDFTVYNGNVNLFNQMRLVMEFPATGGVLNSWIVRTSKLLRYVNNFDYFIAACEVVFVLFVIYFTLEEIMDIRLKKCEYFKDPYNLMDWFILALSYVTISFSIYRTVQVNNLLDRLLVSNSKFENFDRLTFCQELFNQASAVVIFFAWIKIFKYISLNRTLDQLSATLKNCTRDLIYFCVIFFIVFFAYGALGYLLFGELLTDYQNFFKTLFTLFRIILGDFDFVSLRTNFPILGPIFFISFIFIGFFILLNMFMAIINQSYTKVKEEMADAQPEFMLSDYLKMNYGRFVDKLNLRRNRILDVHDILKSDEICSKDEIDFNIWRREMKKKGYSDLEVETFFAQYDKDCDRKLNELEKIHLVRDIARAKNHIKEEFIKFKENRDTTITKDGFEVGDENVVDEVTNEPRQMTRDDFDYVVARIDRMELSVANVISKIDKLFGHLETMEIDKMKKRQEIAKLLSEQNNPEMEKNFNEIIGPEAFK